MLKPSRFLKDFASTAATSIAAACSLVIVTRLLAHGLGQEAFGIYSLSKRILATLMPFSMLGMNVAITRHIAISTDGATKYLFLVSGFILAVMPSVVLFLVGMVFISQLSAIVFQSANYSLVILAVLFTLMGYSCYVVMFALYMGTGKTWKANLWQLALFALWPIIVAGVYAKSGAVHLILFFTGIPYFLTVVPLGVCLWKGIPYFRQTISVADPLKQLLRYSLPRVPGGFVLASMLTLGPFLASYFGSLTDAGYFVVGQSVFALTEAGISAFGLVVLPKAAQLYADGRLEFLRERISDVVALTVHLGLFVTIQFYIWADQLILVWLGHQYSNAIPLMRILLFGLLPHFLYVLLRSVIDAVDEKAINTYNLYVSMLVAMLSSLFFVFVGLGLRGLAVGTVLGFLTRGLATVRYLWRGRWFTVEGCHFKACLLLNAGILTLAFLFKSIITRFYPPTLTLLVSALLFESVLFGLYYLILRRLGVGWVRAFEQRVTRVE